MRSPSEKGITMLPITLASYVLTLLFGILLGIILSAYSIVRIRRESQRTYKTGWADAVDTIRKIETENGTISFVDED